MHSIRHFWRSGLIGKIVLIVAGTLGAAGGCCVVLTAVSLVALRPTAVPTATPEPTPRLPPPIPPLPPPTFNACQDDPNPDAAPNDPVLIVAIDKRAETVVLKNVGSEEVDLTGWHLCSIREHHEHPLSGSLAPGEQKSFPGPAGEIWADAATNNGALYNAQGQLVSYWYDPDR